MQKSKLESLCQLQNLALFSVLLVFFTFSVFAFNGPPVGCTPDSCIKPLTQNFSTQRVGIAQSNPQVTLDVNGEVKVGNNSVVCDVNTEGSIRYNDTTNKMEFCDGMVWMKVGAWECGEIVTYEGQDYVTVEIGTQCWFAENLNVGSKLASGNTLPANNGTIEKWCYDNSDANCDTYGGLYRWDETMGYTWAEGTQGICPSGWHVPTDAEWYILENYLATGTCSSTRTSWECDSAGTALKSRGSSGFNDILAGYRQLDGVFVYRGVITYFRTSSSFDAWSAWTRGLSSSYSTVRRSTQKKDIGLPVRCLMD